MKKTSLLLAGLAAAPASAGTVSITIPQLKVAEYHRPYIAMWVEPAAGGEARTIATWYDVKKMGNEPGTKWLHDLRSWWRKSGRTLKVPADGITSATRAPGTHKVALPADLKPGQYTLYVEAAREGGGREILSIPLNIPQNSGSAAGKTELGAITISR